MNILFLGGKRFFGNFLLNELVKNKKYNIYVVYRKKKPFVKGKNVSFIKCDRDNLLEIKIKLSILKIDLIYDNNCYNLKNCRGLLNYFEKQNLIYIFSSSVMTYLKNGRKKISFNKKSINQLPFKAKLYINEKAKIEKFLNNSKYKYIIFKMHNLIGKKDHSGITQFFFNINLNILKNFNISLKDKFQFAYLNDVIKIISKEIKKINTEKFSSFSYTISNKPVIIQDLIKKLPNKKNIYKPSFEDLPIPLNFIVKTKEIKKQKQSSLGSIVKSLSNV